MSCKAIKLQPDYTLNAAAVSVHTQHTHTQICVHVWDIQIYKLCNFMVLRRWMCKNIILHTSMPEAWKCSLYSCLLATPIPPSIAWGGERRCLHFNIIYMNLGCRKCWPHRAHPDRGIKVETWPQLQTRPEPELSLSELWICRCLSRECEHVLSSVSIWVRTCVHVWVCVWDCVELMI